jgi:hypothetical protein
MGSKFGILPNLEILGKIHHAAMLSQGGVDLAPVNFRFADDSRRSLLQPGWSLCADFVAKVGCNRWVSFGHFT